jgi:hypothetical protein
MSQFNWQRSTHILFHDLDHPSSLTLPITPEVPA